MASLLLGCLGLTSSKFRAKQQAKKEREQDYVENFEAFKEQNAKRVRQLSNQGSTDSTLCEGRDEHTPEMQQHQSEEERTPTTGNAPPKYDDIVEQTTPRRSG